MLTAFEKYALSVPVPALDLPALHEPDDEALAIRAEDIGYDIIRNTQGEDGLVGLLTRLGTFGPCNTRQEL
jgi:hypothetical protein